TDVWEINKIVNKYHRLFFFSLSFFFFFFFLLAHPYAVSATGKVVARVGDAVITETLLEEELARYVPQGGFHTGIDRSQADEYRQAALNDLIEIELLSREARKRGFTASDDMVNAVIEENIKRFGSREKFEQALDARGFTLDFFRERNRKNDVVKMLLRELIAESRYTEEELRDYYAENRSNYKRPESVYLYHILVRVDRSSPEEEWKEKKEFAEQLRGKIRTGADFGSIAYQYSEDPYKYKNGEIGFVHRGRLTPRELEDVAFSLEKGEVSDVVKTIYGYHILKAGERKTGKTMSFDEVKDRMKQDLEQNRFETQKKALLEKLKKEYPVEIIHNMRKQDVEQDDHLSH
ncbi:MAG: peptidyl-prolyl cis-trans isomerase, partial [Nitrospiraceae bacterium]